MKGDALKPRYCVLFVDDEPAVLDGLRKSFRRSTLEVYTAESARLALELLAEVDVDVVVSDERMPQMSGTEFLTRVRRAHPNTIRIVLTGQATVDAAIRAINEGEIYRFLTKPIDAVELEKVIMEALRSNHPDDTELNPDARTQLAGALEHRHPGITKVVRTPQGAILLGDESD